MMWNGTILDNRTRLLFFMTPYTAAHKHTNTKKPKWIYNPCNTLDSTICVDVRKTSVAESQHHEMIVQHTNTKTAEIYSCSAMDRHMQHAVFHTFAFLAFSTLAFWCRIFMSRNFMSRIFSVPLWNYTSSHCQFLHVTYGRGSIFLRRRCVLPVLLMTPYVHIMARI